MSAYSSFQLFAGVVSSAFLLAVAPKFGLGGVWAGLILFMGLRAIAGFWRYFFLRPSHFPSFVQYQFPD
jgi:Na+-driven multidrug efflux pump